MQNRICKYFKFFQEDKILRVIFSENSGSGKYSDMKSVNEIIRDSNSWQAQIYDEVSRETNTIRSVASG